MRADAPLLVAMRCLINHWSANPLACDTIDGISQWWLDPQESVARAALAQAIALLERESAIESLAASDGHVRFRRTLSFDARSLRLRAPSLCSSTSEPGVD